MKYIDAEKLKSEIERRRSEAEKIFNHIFEYASSAKEISEWVSREYNNLLPFIDSLQQEQQPLPSDLDEAAKEYDEAESWSYEALPHPRRTAFKAGACFAVQRIISLIKSRIAEILGDAQPAPVLRIELRELIDKIKEESK